MVFVMDKN